MSCCKHRVTRTSNARSQPRVPPRDVTAGTNNAPTLVPDAYHRVFQISPPPNPFALPHAHVSLPIPELGTHFPVDNHGETGSLELPTPGFSKSASISGLSDIALPIAGLSNGNPHYPDRVLPHPAIEHLALPNTALSHSESVSESSVATSTIAGPFYGRPSYPNRGIPAPIMDYSAPTAPTPSNSETCPQMAGPVPSIGMTHIRVVARGEPPYLAVSHPATLWPAPVSVPYIEQPSSNPVTHHDRLTGSTAVAMYIDGVSNGKISRGVRAYICASPRVGVESYPVASNPATFNPAPSHSEPVPVLGTPIATRDIRETRQGRPWYSTSSIAVSYTSTNVAPTATIHLPLLQSIPRASYSESNHIKPLAFASLRASFFLPSRLIDRPQPPLPRPGCYRLPPFTSLPNGFAPQLPDLPHDLLLYLLSHFTLSSLLSLSCTNRYIRSIIRRSDTLLPTALQKLWPSGSAWPHTWDYILDNVDPGMEPLMARAMECVGNDWNDSRDKDFVDYLYWRLGVVNELEGMLNAQLWRDYDLDPRRDQLYRDQTDPVRKIIAVVWRDESREARSFVLHKLWQFTTLLRSATRLKFSYSNFHPLEILDRDAYVPHRSYSALGLKARHLLTAEEYQKLIEGYLNDRSIVVEPLERRAILGVLWVLHHVRNSMLPVEDRDMEEWNTRARNFFGMFMLRGLDFLLAGMRGEVREGELEKAWSGYGGVTKGVGWVTESLMQRTAGW